MSSRESVTAMPLPSEDKDELYSSAVEGIDMEVLDEGDGAASLGEVGGMVRYNKRGTKRVRKLTSPVWFHFEMLPLGEDERQKSKCKKCGKVYLAESRFGTGNLKRHLDKCLKKDTLDVDPQPLPGSGGSMSPSMSKFDPEKFKELCMAAVIMHDLPFEFMEFSGIRDILLYLRDDLNVLDRNSLKADCIRMFKREQGSIKGLLEAAPGRINLTCNCWFSLNTDGYICLTAHFIDVDWQLQKKILNFCFVPPSHDAKSLAETIYGCLIDWGVDKRIFSITLDSNSVNKISIESLQNRLSFNGGLLCTGDSFYIHCFSHILNLMVQEGLKQIDGVVEKIRESIKYVKGSNIRKKTFLECVADSSINNKKSLRQDVPTRWNSTYTMVDGALFYQHAFMRLEQIDPNYVDCPSQDEWDKVEKINKFLSVFYDAVCSFSDAKYPTANLYFPAAFLIYVRLRKKAESDDEYMTNLATQMLSKFEKYWLNFNALLAMAVALDPRYKFNFVEWCYQKLYGDAGICESMRIKDKLCALFKEYAKTSRPLPTPLTSASPIKSVDHGARNITRESVLKDDENLLEEFELFERENGVQRKTQLELYFEEPRMDRNTELDVLVYWKANQFMYPQVAAMALDILSIPVSTVTSESIFNVEGWVLDLNQSSLGPEALEALVCTRDWLHGEHDKLEVKLEELTEDIMELNI